MGRRAVRGRLELDLGQKPSHVAIKGAGLPLAPRKPNPDGPLQQGSSREAARLGAPDGEVRPLLPLACGQAQTCQSDRFPVRSMEGSSRGGAAPATPASPLVSVLSDPWARDLARVPPCSAANHPALSCVAIPTSPLAVPLSTNKLTCLYLSAAAGAAKKEEDRALSRMVEGLSGTGLDVILITWFPWCSGKHSLLKLMVAAGIKQERKA
ncbi:hypothetical protein NDU88_003442 [Pleurodeles waltl]|uniref:Uncharacterized protein n=1 Tax=Pleurodeles waltl TaxID=8319 RepID=A0AAV7PC82_PLEWA|nr:hypothetical protein NDU88_003442 [Pleurodeles waltl]